MYFLDWLVLFLGNNKEVNTLVVSNAIYSSVEPKSQPFKSRKGLQAFQLILHHICTCIDHRDLPRKNSLVIQNALYSSTAAEDTISEVTI